MDDQAGRLVDDQQVLVLEDDAQRNVLRLVMRGRRLGNLDPEVLVAAYLCSGITDPICARRNRAAADQGLQPFAGQGRDRRCKRPVEPPSGMRRLKPDLDCPLSPHNTDMGEVCGCSTPDNLARC